MTNRVLSGLSGLGLVLLTALGCATGGSPEPEPVERYLGPADQVQCFLPPDVLAQPDAQALRSLATAQRVSIDGTLFVPFVGAVPVVGLTERELGVLLSEQLQASYGRPIQVQARIVSR